MTVRFKTLGSLVLAGLVGGFLGLLGSGELRGAERPATPAAVSTPATAPAGPIGLDTFQDIARRDDAAVVNISTSKVIHEARMENPFFRFFGPQAVPGPWGQGNDQTLTQRSLGSGFVVDAKGFILTNRHVVDGADDVTVTLTNGHHYKAKIVGQDARTDIALLKIEPHETLTALPLGDSNNTHVGEWVMAIGNPFGLGGNSATVGIISFKGRPLDLSTRGTPVEMLQTDAAINPGNSGGPLINPRGEAVGINTLIMTGGAQQYSGVGFAVPIDVARDILPQLRTKGHVVRGWLGVQIQAVNDDLAQSLHMSEARGAIVSQVTNGGPAQKAGLQPGDVILSVDGKEVKDSADLSHRIAMLAPDTKVDLGVRRENGSDETVHATLGTFPEQPGPTSESGESHGYLGITVRDLTPDLTQAMGLPPDMKGAVVTGVEPGGRADAAGLQERDVIVSVDGQPVTNAASLRAAVEKARSAEVMRLRVRRGNGYLFLVVRASS
jgi:serine protease Do